MKKWIIIATAMMAMSFEMLSAQTGFYIDAIFREKHEGAETLIEGGKIEQYHLSLFRSKRLAVTTTRYDSIAQLVEADAIDAQVKEIEKVNGRLTYALLSMPPKRKGPKRYICFQCTSFLKDRFKVTVAYMEGDATIEELKEFFK